MGDVAALHGVGGSATAVDGHAGRHASGEGRTAGDSSVGAAACDGGCTDRGGGNAF